MNTFRACAQYRMSLEIILINLHILFILCKNIFIPYSAVAYVTKKCSRGFRLLIRVIIYQIVHLDK